jgi:hypothetical protein
MGRNVRIRYSYIDEISRINRLEKAIEIDPRPSEEWKKETVEILRTLKLKFLSIESGITSAGGQQ